MTDQPNDDVETKKTSRAREAVLRSIHDRTAEAIDEILRTTPVDQIKASLLQSITQFLRLNDVSAGTLPDETKEARETRELAAQVRGFADDQAREEAEARARGETVTGPMLRHQDEPFEDR